MVRLTRPASRKHSSCLSTSFGAPARPSTLRAVAPHRQRHSVRREMTAHNTGTSCRSLLALQLPAIVPCHSTFHSEATDSPAGNDVDGVAGCMQNAYIASPPYPYVCFRDSRQPSMQCDHIPPYTASSAPWAQGYVAGANENVNYIRQPAVSLSTLSHKNL